MAYPDAEEEIETARDLFDALGSSERNLATIPNFPRLVDAEKADAVVEQIELASQVIDPASYEQEIQKARDDLLETVNGIYQQEPTTSNFAYKMAQKALKDEDEQFFSREELNRLLPSNLRRQSME